MAMLEITVWDEKFCLNSEHDEEFIRHVADYLNNKMKEVTQNDPTEITTKKLALKAALTIAGEYLLMRQEVGGLELAVKRIEEQLGSLH